MVWRTSACLPKDQPRSLMRLLEQGPESQSASSICSGGVSAVMGSSDVDVHSFVPCKHKVISIKAHCLIEGIHGNVDVACRYGFVQALPANVAEGDGLSSKVCFRSKRVRGEKAP